MPLLLDQPVHFRRGCLVEASIGLGDPDRFQHVGDRHRRDVGGKDGLPPRGRDERLRGQIVEFVRLHVLNHPYQRREVRHVGVVKPELIGNAEPAQPMIRHPEMRRAADDTMNLIALADQQLRQISSILAGDARNQSSLGHHSSHEVNSRHRGSADRSDALSEPPADAIRSAWTGGRNSSYRLAAGLAGTVRLRGQTALTRCSSTVAGAGPLEAPQLASYTPSCPGPSRHRSNRSLQAVRLP